MAEAMAAIDIYNAGIQEAKKPGRKGIDPGAPPPKPGEAGTGNVNRIEFTIKS